MTVPLSAEEHKQVHEIIKGTLPVREKRADVHSLGGGHFLIAFPEGTGANTNTLSAAISLGIKEKFGTRKETLPGPGISTINLAFDGKPMFADVPVGAIVKSGPAIMSGANFETNAMTLASLDFPATATGNMATCEKILGKLARAHAEAGKEWESGTGKAILKAMDILETVKRRPDDQRLFWIHVKKNLMNLCTAKIRGIFS